MPKKQFTDDNDSSVLLSNIEGVEIRLTSLNHLFVISRGRVAWPHLVEDSGYLHFTVDDKAISRAGMEDKEKEDDETELTFPEAVLVHVTKVLKKQAEIRRLHALDFDEDDAVYRFN